MSAVGPGATPPVVAGINHDLAVYGWDLRDVLSMQSDVARAVANKIQIEVTPHQQERLTSAQPVNPEAHDLYLKGTDWMRRGDAQKAFVVLRKGVQTTVEALQAHVAEQLSAISVPCEIVFRSSLPKSLMGKVLKSALEAERTAETAGPGGEDGSAD